MIGDDHPPEKTDSIKPQKDLPPAPEPMTEHSPAQPATAQQLQQTETRIEDRMSSFERSMLRLTRAGVGIAILTGFIFLGQLYVMYAGGTQTNKLVKYADTQAQAADNIAQASDDFTDSAFWMEEHMQDAANAMQEGVDTADQNTKTTIKNAQTSFRDEQRAWLGVLDAVTITFTNTEAWKASVVFFNSGRTAARNVQTSGMYKLSNIPLSGPSPEDIKRLAFRPAQSVAPQGRYNQVMGGATFGEPTTEGQTLGAQALASRFEDIKAKKLILYYFGVLKYDDIFGHQRETQFCIFLSDPGATNQPAFCDAFNDLN
jgi:hypothetical protein